MTDTEIELVAIVERLLVSLRKTSAWAQPFLETEYDSNGMYLHAVTADLQEAKAAITESRAQLESIKAAQVATDPAQPVQ